MNDIAEHTPKQSKTVAAIYAHYKKIGDAEPSRGYLGASVIGHPCERYLWYLFRDCCKPDFSGRMYRLFATGDLEEIRLVNDLTNIGCEVHETNDTGEQFEVSAFGGHFKGHMDGCALGVPEAPKTWHVLEFKTYNAKSFAQLVKKGIKESKPQHYAQVQIEMHLTGMRRALYIARNKDTDDLYSERIRYEKAKAEALMERAERIITNTIPPERITEREDYYLCNWCDAKAICYGAGPSGPALPLATLSCRQCCHATSILEGEGAKWKCEVSGHIQEDSPCKNHLILPGLIAFAEPTNAGDDFIKFMNSSGLKWCHGKGGAAFSSEELRILSPEDLTNPLLWGTKGLFGAVAVACGEDILDRYPKEDSRIIWKGQLDALIPAWRQHYKEELAELTSIARCNFPDHSVVEYDSGRIAIAYPETSSAEIREGVK